jgi:uncharacterized protein
MTYKKIVLVALTLSLNLALFAQDCIPSKPNPPRLVNDLANLLDDNSERQLENALVNFNDTSSTQIVVLTVKDLCGYDAAGFSYEIGEKWGVGDAKFNNGVVIMIKPKVGNDRGQAFIATGYGLEGVLPDATAFEIVNQGMIPFFKQNDYRSGIFTAAQTVMDITGGEYSAENYNSRNKSKKKTSVIPFLVILVFIGFMLFGTVNRARSYGKRNNVGLLAALFLMGSMSRRHGGQYNNFTSGGGGFGGFGGGSGGGFGGFGGGSFGGGGAGGSW